MQKLCYFFLVEEQGIALVGKIIEFNKEKANRYLINTFQRKL